jgi:hypothetical protein
VLPEGAGTLVSVLSWLLVAFAILIVVPSAVMLVMGIVAFVKTADSRDGTDGIQRGFEVKLTGQTPVSGEKKRDNDHG